MKAFRSMLVPLTMSILALGCARGASAGHLEWIVAVGPYPRTVVPDVEPDPGTWAMASGLEGLAAVGQTGLYFTQVTSAGLAAHLAEPGVGGHAKASVKVGHEGDVSFYWAQDYPGDPIPLLGTAITATEIATGTAAVDADPGNSSHGWVKDSRNADTDSVLPWGTQTPHWGQNAAYYSGPWLYDSSNNPILDSHGNVISNQTTYAMEQWLWSGVDNDGVRGFTISAHISTIVSKWTTLPEATIYGFVGYAPEFGTGSSGNVEVGNEGSGTGFHDGTTAFLWTDTIIGTWYGSP